MSPTAASYPLMESLLHDGRKKSRVPATKSRAPFRRIETPIHFSGGLFRGATDELDEQVGRFLRQGSMVGIVAWLLLLWAAFRYAPADSFERLHGPEKHANITVLCLLLYVNVSRILRMVIRDRGFLFVNSGVMVGSVTVQTIAIVSISLMVFFPTPVIVDPVTGIRSHLVRWCEWTVAAFLMTFLTESVDMPLSIKERQQADDKTHSNKNTRAFPVVPWIHGLVIGLSTSAGALSAFCTTQTQWWTVIGISWILFCSLFVRLRQRYVRLKKMSPGILVEDREEYDRAKYSFKTIAVCSTVWTGLAGSWTVISLVAPQTTNNSVFSNPALVLITESFFEAISKVWYADFLIEIHNIVFDDTNRTMRRLEELKSLMSAVWNHSSDILIWGSRTTDGSNIINGVVSPKGVECLAKIQSPENLSTLLLEIDPDTHAYRSFLVDLSSPITREAAMALRDRTLHYRRKGVDILVTGHHDQNVSVVASLLCEAHGSIQQTETTLMKELVSPHDETVVHRCETKITKLGENTSLIVMRDISERHQRFEAEKKLIEEQTARRKDFEANRFTRHEVKNGLLAAIGLMDSIRENSANELSIRTTPTTISTSTHPVIMAGQNDLNVMEDDESDSGERTTNDVGTEAAEYSSGDSYSQSDVGDRYGELDNTLRDILDTIMDHAMSLDVINEEYKVRLEHVSVPEVLLNIRRQATRGPGQLRFSLVCSPLSFPILGLDSRLLRHIYQNALSNASRYGKPNGKIDTRVSYDQEKEEFKMEVINEPGPNHATLSNMSKEDVENKVFSQGSRLMSEDNVIAASNSSGDGAWIMKKCSKIMKGDVGLSFENDRTVFTFWCPARNMSLSKNSSDLQHSFKLTRLPPKTWGVVVDDSGIQRKLMDRFLKIAGIDRDRRIILGESPDELFHFCDRVREILASNPSDKVILIADENLDVVEGGAHHTTVSGSLCIKKLLESLESAHERRLLALVRSANDSSTEIETYVSRAHGYLLKAPIDKDGVLGVIQPWWIKQFGDPDSDSKFGDKNLDHSSCTFSESEIYDVTSDIIQAIEVISALCKAGSRKSLRNRWNTIREKLHALKGDLKSTVVATGHELDSVVSDIDLLWQHECPKNLQERWKEIEAKVYEIVNGSSL